MKFTFRLMLALVVITSVIIVLLSLPPIIMHAPSKYTPRKTSPGIPTVLQQIRHASLVYDIREGKAPSSMNDLAGITVLASDGKRIPLSTNILEEELGTNISAIKYYPEFRALGFGAVPDNENVLAYIAEFKNPEYSQVIFYGGNTKQLPTSDVKTKVERLRSLLKKTLDKSTNDLNSIRQP